MVRKSFIFSILLCLFLSFSSFAQHQGAENSAQGVSGLATISLFSININPALLTALDSSQLGVNINKVAFAGRALGSGLQYAAPFHGINTGVGFYNFGNNYYNLSRLNVSLAKALDPKQSIGFSASYLKEFVYLQSNEKAITASFGYQYQVNAMLRLGASVHQVFYTSNDRLTRSYANFGSHGGIGLHIQATEALSLSTEMLIHEFLPIQMGLGLKYSRNGYDIMMGLNSHQSLLNAGIGIPLKSFRLNLTYGFHQRLGTSIQSSLIYKW